MHPLQLSLTDDCSVLSKFMKYFKRTFGERFYLIDPLLQGKMRPKVRHLREEVCVIRRLAILRSWLVLGRWLRREDLLDLAGNVKLTQEFVVQNKGHH